MELEKRVKTLEQEVKLLKNQVQKTLLEIQEQVLVHYHPSLRSADEMDTTAVPAPAPKAATNGSADFYDMFSEPEPDMPIVRKITMADLRHLENGNGVATAVPDPKPAPTTPAANNHLSTLRELATWIAASVPKIGVERTRTMLNIRLQAQALAPAEAETIQQLFTLLENEDAQNPATVSETVQAFLDLMNV